MRNLRFALAAIAAFGVAFAGLSLFGMPRFNRPFVQADAPPAAKIESRPVTNAMKPDASPAPPAQGIKSATLPETDVAAAKSPGNQLAATAISAANAYALAPCNPAAKAAFIVAASTYSKSVAGEPANTGLVAAASLVDPGVRDAMSAAFRAGGVSPDEFPVGTLVPITAKSVSPCGGGRHVDNTRR